VDAAICQQGLEMDGSDCIVRLSANNFHVELAPLQGGCLAGYWQMVDGRQHDLLRPTPEPGRRRLAPNQFSCFPIAPFFGRARDGKFQWNGKTIQLAFNLPEVRHAVHGHPWQREWRLVSVEENEALIAYDHEAGDWPWAYGVTQQTILDQAGRLSVTLQMTNYATESMPAGLGLHPYFPRQATSMIKAYLPDVYQTDVDLLPLARVPNSIPFQDGVPVTALDLDTIFAGWDGVARFNGLRLTANTTHATIVAKTGADFFTFEPCTQCSDAINRQATGTDDTGLVALYPGETLTLKMVLEKDGY
jgi:aldose 1-epimerase